MIIPLRTDSPLRHSPYANWALIVANFVVFFVQIAYNGQHPEASAFVEPLVLNASDPHLWQYFSYAFIHGSWLHIIGNMLFLYIFGNNINDRMGNLGYLAFYLAGGVFAGIGYVVVTHGSVLGASGAVAAVTGAYLILMPRSNITILYFWYLIGTAEIASLWVILFFFGQDVISEMFPQMFGGQVAHMAHIAGTLFGAVVCFVMLSLRLLPRDQFDVLALVQRWNRRRQYRDMVSRGYDPFGYLPPSTPRAGERFTPPDPKTQQAMELRAQISEAVSRHDLAQAASKYQHLIALDPNQVLPRNAQLDVANFLASQQLYPQAAAAYEQFQRYYPNYDQIEQVHLMLGVIYARYLQQYERAKQYLVRALARLHATRDIDLARSELAHIEPTTNAPGPMAP